MRSYHRCARLLLCATMFSLAAGQVPIAAAQKAQATNGFNLAFVDADVRRVVDAILGSMLGTNYTLDPEVTGSITLRTTNPVPSSELIPMLERALSSVDAVIVKRGESYRVVPRKKARGIASVASTMQPSDRTSIDTSGSNARNFAPSSPGFASETIGLQYASAGELVKVAEGLLGPDIVSAGTTGRNEVVISGSGEERDAAKKLIARFDVDNFASMNFEIWKLEDVDAETLVAELERVFEPPYDIIGSRVRLVPLPRLRSILAIAADKSDLARIEPWVRRLDNGGSGKRKLYNYAVQNGRARDIAGALQQVLGGSSSTSTSPSPRSEPPPVDVRGDDSSLSERPTEVRSSPDSFVPPQIGMGESALRIVPNESNNSLLIFANGEEYGFIREALEKLDQPVAQVLIEATLAEVTLTDDLRYGVNFQALTTAGSAGLTFTNSNNSGGTPASSFPGFSVSLIGNDIASVLNALQSKTNVRVLSAPKLMTLNNQAALLQVGDQVPIVTQQAQSVTSPGAPIVNTIELRDTGVILQVTPRINESGTITLDISQEVSDVATTTTSGINSPTIQQRKLTSTVATKSGQMVALGGLIRNRQTREKSGIPLLSQIPVLGGLFGRKVDTGSRTELIILITPTIIRSPDDVKRTVDALIDGLDLTAPLVNTARSKQVGPSLEQTRNKPAPTTDVPMP